MNRLIRRAATRILGTRRHLTDAQENGAACVLCGYEFPRLDGDYRASYGWYGIRHRVYACNDACILEVVDDVESLFRAAVPARRDVWFWRLGVDDVPLTTAPDGSDMADEAYVDALEAGPQLTVEIVHPGGVLTTRPIPVEYAELVAAQAQRLGFTAMIDDEVGAR